MDLFTDINMKPLVMPELHYKDFTLGLILVYIWFMLDVTTSTFLA